MRKRRNSTPRVKAPTQTKGAYVYENLPPFHESFPIKITHQDGKEEKVCYFACEAHLESYLKRCKLKKNQIKKEKTPPEKK